MNEIATTIEQSKKLIELGLNADTADMYWEYDSFQGFHRLELFEDGFPKTLNKDDIPAWSLPALMELMPNKIWINDDLYFVCFKKNSAELRGPITWDGRQKTKLFKADNILDATFEMMCYLLENKLI